MQKCRRFLRIGLALAWACALTGCAMHAPREAPNHAADLTVLDAYTLAGKKHLVRDYPPLDAAGDLQMVVEIPTGTNAKWEVESASGRLKWEFKKGKPRVVAYLGYPGNYGIVPRTLLPKELGGDGDPLDVIALGPALPRGTVVAVRPIGVLKLLDGGEQDDKIIAIVPDSPLGGVSSLEQLRQQYKGIAEIIETWFANYKGPGVMESRGFADEAKARRAIEAAIAAYATASSTTK